MSRSFLLLRDRFQNISRPGDVRQVDLGFDFFFATQRARRLRGLRRPFRATAEMRPYFFRFVLFEGAGVGLLLRDSDKREHIKNGLAFYFQLSCEIVDSNLTHPPFLVPPRCA